ncbi:SRPBCC family protein [Sulfurisoma sediminicola]|uniref:Carbon monoxide dehydrogenase subunit G n=1 Tax=Sulfurisoma sediminicola TaxID=1381557 RepID=A0A497XDS6_9PROT|nr:SRPBCC family protein [Sulfurisoma sediminicola]RLJ64705.1 carbon monoxide dehydrogenase subunit G [Sulfurisoma sediminicola]
MARLAPLLILLVGLGAAALPARAADERNGEVEVTVRISGDDVQVTASYTVDVTPQEAWAVLTDFDNMARFVSNLETSEVVSRQDNVVRVRTKGAARFGPLHFPFEAVRELTLTPYERIQSRQVSGTLKRFEGVTQLIPTAQGTRITYRGDSTSNQSIPPIVGPSFIKSETEEQFNEMRTEILRRRLEAGRKNR